MMKLLGFKRIMLIVCLLAVNMAVIAGLYLYLQPQQSDKDMQLRVLRGQISEKQADIDRIQVAFEQLEQQQSTFDELRAHGFFGNQGRRQAEMVLSDIQKKSGVISAVANIQPGKVVDNEEAQKAEHKILESKVDINVEALDDTDIYRYIYLLERYFPGHVSVEKIDLVRKGQITDAVLRGIASGQTPPLVEAKMFVTWRTMIPQSQIVEGQQGG